MCVVILGAGGVGGYLGARLITGGADVTFLTREARAATLTHLVLWSKARSATSRRRSR